MKTKSLTSILTLSVITLASTVISSNPVLAQASKFVCKQNGEYPTTVAKTERGDVTVIEWRYDFGFYPLTRCKKVSARFETYRKRELLGYMTTGLMNGEHVICIARSEGSDCDRDLPEHGLLWTIKPGDDASEELKKLTQVNFRAGSSLVETDDRIYIDMNEFLKKAPIYRKQR